MLHNHKYCRYQDYGELWCHFWSSEIPKPIALCHCEGLLGSVGHLAGEVLKNDDLIVIALSVIGVIGNHDDTVYNDIIYMIIYYHNNNNIDDNSDDYSVDH